jgi:transcriptional regulator with XRE-family HTH domain
MRTARKTKSKQYNYNARSVGSTDKVLGQRVRARRLDRKMSQAELGQKLGVTFQQIQKYEEGTNRIGTVRLVEIADALATDVAFFIGDMGNSKITPQGSRFEAIMATKDGVDILEAMMKLETPWMRRSVIEFVRKLGNEGKER